MPGSIIKRFTLYLIACLICDLCIIAILSVFGLLINAIFDPWVLFKFTFDFYVNITKFVVCLTIFIGLIFEFFRFITIKKFKKTSVEFSQKNTVFYESIAFYFLGKKKRTTGWLFLTDDNIVFKLSKFREIIIPIKSIYSIKRIKFMGFNISTRNMPYAFAVDNDKKCIDLINKKLTNTQP